MIQKYAPSEHEGTFAIKNRQNLKKFTQGLQCWENAGNLSGRKKIKAVKKRRVEKNLKTGGSSQEVQCAINQKEQNNGEEVTYEKMQKNVLEIKDLRIKLSSSTY